MIGSRTELLRLDAGGIRLSARALQGIRDYVFGNCKFDRFPTPASLDRFALENLGNMVDLALKAKNLLESNGGALIIENFPCVHSVPFLRDFVLLSFASSMGQPTACDAFLRTVIWEVTPSPNLEGLYTPTISESAGAAPLHTDSSYRTQPERYVALLMLTPAKDGGASLIVNGLQVLAELSRSSAGYVCIELMRSLQFPFRVPTVFATDRAEDRPECVVHPIIDSAPLVRFRYDSLLSGLSVCLFTLPLRHSGQYRILLRSWGVLRNRKFV